MKVIPKDYHTSVLIALHPGMRKSEELNLKWADIDFARKLISIKETKLGEARRVPMKDVVIEALKAQPTMLHNPFVFYRRQPGRPLKNGVKEALGGGSDRRPSSGMI